MEHEQDRNQPFENEIAAACSLEPDFEAMSGVRPCDRDATTTDVPTSVREPLRLR